VWRVPLKWLAYFLPCTSQFLARVYEVYRVGQTKRDHNAGAGNYQVQPSPSVHSNFNGSHLKEQHPLKWQKPVLPPAATVRGQRGTRYLPADTQASQSSCYRKTSWQSSASIRSKAYSPGSNHVAEAKRLWDSLSEEQREAYRVRAREAERKYGPSGLPPAEQFRGDYPWLPIKVMMKDVRARIGEEAYAALDWEREALLGWDALTPEEQLGYKEREVFMEAE
jgi:hypothetical protein